jgi:hypothetical protein
MIIAPSLIGLLLLELRKARFPPPLLLSLFKPRACLFFSCTRFFRLSLSFLFLLLPFRPPAFVLEVLNQTRRERPLIAVTLPPTSFS